MDLTKPWFDVREAESLHVCLSGLYAANKRTICSNDGCMVLLLSYQPKPQLASSILIPMTPQQ